MGSGRETCIALAASRGLVFFQVAPCGCVLEVPPVVFLVVCEVFAGSEDVMSPSRPKWATCGRGT